MKLAGAFTALVTPFTADGKNVDYDKLREIVEWQIQEGIDGLVPVSDCPLARVHDSIPVSYLTRCMLCGGADGHDGREPDCVARGA